MKDEHMSLWGIGPLFVVLSIIFFVFFIYLSLQFDLFFTLAGARTVMIAVGGLLAVTGVCLWAPAARSIDDCIRAGVLAQRGVYGIVRNPVYSGFLFFFTGICVALYSPLILSTPVLVYFLLKIMLRKEDKILMEVFGGQYAEYKERVNQIIPNPAGMMSAWFYPVDSVRYGGGLFIVRDGDVNAFVYTNGSDYICIDAGRGASRLKGEFSRLNIDPALVSAVFLTHTDTDHRGGLEIFSNAVVYMGRSEEQMINGGRARKLFYRNKPLRRGYCLLDDGGQVRLSGIQIKAIETPGHTKGHMVYLVDDRYFFTGDSVVYQNGTFKPFYRLFNMDNSSAVFSAAKVKQVMKNGIEAVCTAHTGVIIL